MTTPPEAPIRVVLLTSGPSLEHGVKQFAAALEAHPGIELVAIFCEAQAQGWQAVVRDRWRRRGLLALPLLWANAGGHGLRFLSRPRAEIALSRQLHHLRGRIQFMPDMHAPAVMSQLETFKADLGLSYGSPILKPALFEIPRLGTLGIHHGKVPQYRGKKTAFWAMYNGEKTAGVTIQKINAGLDTGEIVQEGEVPIGRRTPGQVWRDLEQLGIALYIEAIMQMKTGTAVLRPQTGPKGKLYRDPKLRHLLTVWARRWHLLPSLTSEKKP